MYIKRFQQGDSVQYVGKKESLHSKLNGREGFVDARIQGSETELCVSFGDDAYILDEVTDLAKFIKRERVDHTDKNKGPAVEKRRGVSDKSGGKKRRNQEED